MGLTDTLQWLVENPNERIVEDELDFKMVYDNKVNYLLMRKGLGEHGPSGDSLQVG